MSRSIFITRPLDPSSPLLQLSAEYNITGSSLLRLQALPLDPRYLEADWVFFYSKHGVGFFADQAVRPIVQRIACIGESTAATATRALGVAVDYIGDGHGHSTAGSFLEVLQVYEKVAFVRAQQSLQAVQHQLPRHQVIDIVLYTNEIDRNKTAPPTDIAILTSPLNAGAYIDSSAYTISTTVIAIGRTTGRYLESRGITDYLLPSTPTEKSISILLQSLS